MSQTRSGIDLDTSVGYLLKEASSALRVSMEAALRPLGMTITHYSCLELLAQRPGLSNSQLARGAFVTRQSMNVLLQSLEREGLVERVSEEGTGRVIPTRLTDRGRAQLHAASAAVKNVEDRMVAALTPDDHAALTATLRQCVDALRSPA